jgi:recombinational DNA repair protein RecR
LALPRVHIDYLIQEVILALEMVVEGAFGDAYLGRNIPHTDSVVPEAMEHIHPRLENIFPPDFSSH